MAMIYLPPLSTSARLVCVISRMYMLSTSCRPFYAGLNIVDEESSDIGFMYNTGASTGHLLEFDLNIDLGRSFTSSSSQNLPAPLGDVIVGGAVLFEVVTATSISVSSSCSVLLQIKDTFQNPVANQQSMYVRIVSAVLLCLFWLK